MEKMKPQQKILRIAETTALTGLSTSTINRKQNEGLFPARLTLSERTVGWPSNEVGVMVKALTMGLTENETKELVGRLHNLRRRVGVDPVIEADAILVEIANRQEVTV
jgi:predicted DNA-binding transcriptional regulator AlpA